MQPNTEESHNGNGNCSGNNQLQPCACCAALAQLRMPWMDAAVQHAAPHYPVQNSYASPYGYMSSHAQSQARAFEDSAEEEFDEDDEPEKKTVFFRLPGFGKSEKKSTRNKKRRDAQHKSARQSKASGDNAKFAQQDAKPSASANASDIDGDAEADADETKINDNAEHSDNQDWQAADISAKKPRFRLAFGLQGIAVTLFGILFPAFMFVSGIMSTPKRITLVLLHHPVETIIEFLLVAAIPLVNYLVWSAICKNRANLSRWLLMGLGACIGTGLVLSGICFAALFGNHEDLADAIGSDFSMGFAWLSMLSLLSSAVSAYLANRLRLSWELQSSRMKVAVQAITGMVLSVLAFAGSEYHPWCVRMAQYNAVSKDEKIRKEGLAWLRQLNPEREMRMECSDSRAAGLPGLFFPIKASAQHQLYFTLTGTPYSFRDEKATDTDLSSMPNDFLTRHVVGDKIPQFELTRSSLNGVLHADTLTSSLNWTFVVKNGSSYPHEMRAELGLPAGAAITGLTVWNKGEPNNAEFVASGKIEGVASTNAGNDTPGMVTDLGHGRVLLHCYPVPAEEELKVRVSMVVPLKSESEGLASIITPQLIASNFEMEGEHSIRLRSKTPLSSNARGLESGIIPGENTISGTLSAEQLESSPLVVTAKRSQIGKPYAVLDKLAMQMKKEEETEKERLRVERERQKELQRQQENKQELGQVVLMIDGSRGVKTQLEDYSKMIRQQKADSRLKTIKPRIITIKPQYVVEDIKRTAAPAPSQLIVVIDGSATMNKYRKELSKGLASLPANIPTKVIIASQEDGKLTKAQARADILPKLEKLEFVGGQDNLKAVVNAAELAGETKGAAVLWIHGPQPVINREIYIVSQYESAPAFYELPVVAGTDTFEFFKNHAEIGPFVQVPRSGDSIATDLSDFFAKWNPNNNNYVASIEKTETLPKNAIQASAEEARELITLRAVQQCNQLISTRHFRKAARIAVRYGFVSQVSSAYMGSNTNTPQDADSNPSQNVEGVSAGTTSSNDAFDTASSGEQIENTGSNYSGSQTYQGGSGSAPALQGATNGTIGPQGADATVIMGVNTAGTVRVNNLANLEALLNIIANLGELGALISGIGLIVHGFLNKAIIRLGDDVELGPGGRVVLGGLLVVMGFALPGILNWFVASARDANLFS